MIQIKFGDYVHTLNKSKGKAKYEQCYQLKSTRKVVRDHDDLSCHYLHFFTF